MVLPPADFDSITLVTKTVPALETFHRIFSKRYPDPLGFGRTPSRFSDPRVHLPPSERYGVLYLGSAFEGCVFETLLRDRFAGQVDPPLLTRDEIVERVCAEIVVNADLELVDLTGRGPHRMRVPTDVAHHSQHDLSQQWALAFHQHPARVDGIYYSSRHQNEMVNLAVFDRAVGKLSPGSQMSISAHPQWPILVAVLNIGIIKTPR